MIKKSNWNRIKDSALWAPIQDFVWIFCTRFNDADDNNDTDEKNMENYFKTCENFVRLIEALWWQKFSFHYFYYKYRMTQIESSQCWIEIQTCNKKNGK